MLIPSILPTTSYVIQVNSILRDFWLIVVRISHTHHACRYVRSTSSYIVTVKIFDEAKAVLLHATKTLGGEEV
jgi:hypothetical protein